MDKINAGARSARYLQIERLYREGHTLQQIGARLEPQVTPQRIGQLLREGARLGLYLMPTMHRDRERDNERRLTDIEVRAVLMTTKRKEQAAKILGISKAALESRFGHVLRGVLKEKSLARRREHILEKYGTLAAQLGFNPAKPQMPHILARRIQLLYGSLTRFYKAEGIVPRDRRRRPTNP